MTNEWTRRQFIQTLAIGAAGAWFSPTKFIMGTAAPTAPVAVAKCRAYGPEVLPTLKTMFDQLGGLDKLVKGKTVAIKLNMTGSPHDRVKDLPVGLTSWVHPQVIGATVHLLGQAGAQRIRLLESAGGTAAPLEEFMLSARWVPKDFTSAASRVEFENTNYLGQSTKYSHLRVPNGGLMFKAYDVNHSYEDCDVFVSLAKLKEHATAGVTLSMKNCFGITPCTIYGDGAGKNAPSEKPRGGRGMLHDGHRQPSAGSPSENDPNSPREGGYRVPRVTADLVAARPIHLAVIDGIESAAGGEGSWVSGFRPARPGLLVAGTNCVTTDAVATALMGFDPTAERGKAPFEKCDSTLKLAEDYGLGTRDLRRIEVLGTPISKAAFNIRAV